jgi:hypothetical protein
MLKDETRAMRPRRLIRHSDFVIRHSFGEKATWLELFLAGVAENADAFVSALG